MKTMFILPFLLLFGFSGSEDPSTNEDVAVYLCDSSSSEVYHYKKDCRGLSRCNHRILKVTLEDAKKKYERRLCKWED